MKLSSVLFIFVLWTSDGFAHSDEVLRDALQLRVPVEILAEEQTAERLIGQINALVEKSLKLEPGYNFLKLDPSVNHEKEIFLDMVGNSKLINVIQALARRLKATTAFEDGRVRIRFQTPTEMHRATNRTPALEKHRHYDGLVDISVGSFNWEGTTEDFLQEINKIVTNAGFPIQIVLLDARSASKMLYMDLAQARLGLLLDAAALQLNPKHGELPSILFDVLHEDSSKEPKAVAREKTNRP